MTIGSSFRQSCRALLAGAVLVLFPGHASAGEIAHVIELFTSQGCSSCPPADRLLATLARDPKTVALSFAVDYWDYIGWKDIFASPVFTARQQAYARLSSDGRVYTPQVVIDGLKGEIGSNKAAIIRDLDVAPSAEGAMTVPLQITESGGYLHVAVGAGQPSGAGVYVLRVSRSRSVDIGRGENSGRTVTYTNVVRAMSKIGDWNGQAAQFDMLELKGDDEGYVVLLQSGDPAKPSTILAAAKTAGL